MNDDFKSYIQNDTNVLDVVESSYPIKSIIGSISITQANVFEQDQFIDGYSSTIVMNDVNITNITFTEPVIKTSLSTLNGSDIVVANINNPSNSANFFISCSTTSIINISGLNYTSSQASLILLNNVKGVIDDLDITSVSSVRAMVQIDRSYDLSLTQLSIDDVNTRVNSIVSVTDSTGLKFNNILISNIAHLIFKIQNSIIDRAHSLDFNNCYQGIKVLDFSTIHINSSIFDNIGDSGVISGGVIQTSDSNITISNSNFTN